VARVAPEDKIRLVTLLQQKQNIVAMTGDGVNDAPALKKADIGVAMGITGTEVSKGAAVMILTDDNFATIVKAVEYGRAIYDNLSKYIRFQMTALVAFIASYLGASIFFIANGVPFQTTVIIWINFLVQVPLAIALGFDDPSPGLMERKPRPLSQPVLSSAQWRRMIFLGLLMTIGTLVLEVQYTPDGDAVMYTMGFAVFCLFNIAMALAVRSETESALNRDIISNRHQLMLFGLALLLTLPRASPSPRRTPRRSTRRPCAAAPTAAVAPSCRSRRQPEEPGRAVVVRTAAAHIAAAVASVRSAAVDTSAAAASARNPPVAGRRPAGWTTSAAGDGVRRLPSRRRPP
jgi:magnesium-transporting ATPase (P-type)